MSFQEKQSLNISVIVSLSLVQIFVVSSKGQWLQTKSLKNWVLEENEVLGLEYKHRQQNVPTSESWITFEDLAF